MSSVVEEDEATSAAKAALVALRGLTSSPQELHQEHVLLLPKLNPVPTTEIIRVLAQLRKPISCVAMELSKTLVLGWWERDPSLEQRWMDYRKIDVEDTLRPYRERRASRGAEARFALLVGGEITALSLTTFELWLTQYDFPLVSVQVMPATGALHSEGFSAVIRVSRSQGGILDATAI